MESVPVPRKRKKKKTANVNFDMAPRSLDEKTVKFLEKELKKAYSISKNKAVNNILERCIDTIKA